MSIETELNPVPTAALILEEEPMKNLPTPPTGKVFDKPREVTSRSKKKDIPEGMWTLCKSCGEMITNKELEALLKVCPKCHYHFVATAAERISWLVDEVTFQEIDADLIPVDAIKFKDLKPYSEKLKAYQKETGLKDAVLTGFGQIQGHKVGIGVMDFSFIGASMGSVVGEKITRLIEKSTKKKLPVILVSSSGGARMQEGILSLMQMAKTSAALARHSKAGLAYLAILTHPTMGGVTASFASLGDLVLAEPKAMIGFAGARVIRETTREELPEEFQTSEFLLQRGLLDMIVHRKNMKSTLAHLLDFIAVPKN